MSKVRFSSQAPNISNIPNFSFRKDLWYQKNELQEFRSSANLMAYSLEQDSKKKSCKNLGCKECYRGLEHRASLERQRKKILTIAIIIKAQDVLEDCCQSEEEKASRLAQVSLKATLEAKKIALEEAKLDEEANKMSFKREKDFKYFEFKNVYRNRWTKKIHLFRKKEKKVLPIVKQT